jgi:hypothetical protein
MGGKMGKPRQMFEGTTKNAHLQKFCAKVHFKCKINANGRILGNYAEGEFRSLGV